MKIICLNGWGGKLGDELLAYIAAADADVLCLQEVVHSPASKKGWLTYRDGAHVLPQRANFFQEVASALPDHAATFCPAAKGVLWDGDETVPSQWGLATFVRRSLHLIGQVQGFVHKEFSPEGYGDHPRSRSAHGVRVYDVTLGRAVAITHMHGLRDLKGKMDTPERALQAKRFLAQAQHLAQPDDLSVLCGDFNVAPDSQTLSLMNEAGFTELVTTRGFDSTRTALYEKPLKFADYMLINDESAVRDFEVVYEPVVSDHCPLILTL